jgi:hypothetical protein
MLPRLYFNTEHYAFHKYYCVMWCSVVQYGKVYRPFGGICFLYHRGKLVRWRFMVHKSEEHEGKIIFKIFIAGNFKLMVFWDATSCSSGDGDLRFGGIYCLHFQRITPSVSSLNCISRGRFLRTIGVYLPKNTASCRQKTLNAVYLKACPLCPSTSPCKI